MGNDGIGAIGRGFPIRRVGVGSGPTCLRSRQCLYGTVASRIVRR